MGFFEKFIDTEKTSQMKVATPKEVYAELLKNLSGSSEIREIAYTIAYDIIAFKGVCGGVGTSTLVANTAVALARMGLNICVIDTSVLRPVQDILLKTKYKEKVLEDKRLDWFDMPYTKLSVLHESDVHKGISVLSFYGKDRGIIDLLSVNDNAELVNMALTELHNKFDIILIDCCQEMSSVNTACLQQSKKVIQVWSDTPTCIYNISNFLNECGTISCPLDKMRGVVYSMITDDVIGTIDDILAQYKLKKITQNDFSENLRRLSVLDKLFYQYVSPEEDIQIYTDCIIDIVVNILGLDKRAPGGTITSQDIADGKVPGTAHKKLKDNAEKLEMEMRNIPIAKTLAEADAQLGQTDEQKDFTSKLESFKENIPISEDADNDADFAPIETEEAKSEYNENSDTVSNAEDLETSVKDFESSKESKKDKKKLFGKK